jgi:hypothetical protein
MPIILEDIEDDVDIQEIYLEPQSESILATPPNEGGIRHVSDVEETKVNIKE